MASKVVSKVGSSYALMTHNWWLISMTNRSKRSSRRPSPPRVAAYLGTKGVIRRCSTIPDEGASTSGSFRSESGKETSSNQKSSSLDTSQTEAEKTGDNIVDERPPKIRIVQPSIDEVNFKSEVPLTNQKKVSLNPFQTPPPPQPVQFTPSTPTLPKKSTTSILKKSPVSNSPVIQRFSKIEFSKNSSLPNVNKSNSNSSLNINQARLQKFHEIIEIKYHWWPQKAFIFQSLSKQISKQWITSYQSPKFNLFYRDYRFDQGSMDQYLMGLTLIFHSLSLYR